MAITPRSHRVRLTGRDHAAVEFLCQVRALRLDDLAALLGHLGGSADPVGERTARNVLSRWTAVGLARFVANPRGGLGVAISTREGLRCAGLDGLPEGLPRWRDIPHALTAAAVAVAQVRRTGGRWISDDQLRAHQRARNASHRPDGILVLPDQNWAIEVERTAKSAHRWRANVLDTLQTWHGVAYFTTAPVGLAFTRWLASPDCPVTAQNRRRIAVVPLGGLAR